MSLASMLGFPLILQSLVPVNIADVRVGSGQLELVTAASGLEGLTSAFNAAADTTPAGKNLSLIHGNLNSLSHAL